MYSSGVKSSKSREHYYTEWLQNNEQWENRFIQCLHTVEKYKKVESIIMKNDYETTSKKWTDKKQTCSVFCKSD